MKGPNTVAEFTWDQLKVEGRGTGRAVETAGLPNGLDAVPPSYRRFMEGFGYGRTAWLFLIFPAVAVGWDSLCDRSAALKAMLHESLELELVELEPHGSADLLRRCVPFGCGENGETLAWDPDDHDATGEMQIYVVGSKTLGVFRAGRTLEQFVGLVTSERIRDVLPGYAPFPPTFAPLDFA